MFDLVDVIVSFLQIDLVPYVFGSVLLYGAFVLTMKMVKFK